MLQLDIKKTILYRSYKHFNEDLYKAELNSAPFHVADIFDDVNDSLWFCQNLIEEIIDHHAPRKKKIVKHKQVPYMNSTLRRAINVRNMLRRKYNSYKSNERWKIYKYQRNYVTKLRKQSIKNYMKTACDKTNSFWDTVKPMFSEKGVGCNDDILLKANESIIHDKNKVSNMLNDYFVNAAKTSINKPYTGIEYECDVRTIVNSFSSHPSIKNIKELMDNSTGFNFSSVSLHKVQCLLESINVKKSTGFDNIPPKLIKIGANILCYPIHTLINTCLKDAKFPDLLKYAEVSPIYKKGDALNMSNYRPISILPCLSKIFEKIIVEQMSAYFERIFSTSMSGFRKAHNCQNVILQFIEKCKQRADEGKVSGAVLMDLSKAFDTLHHGLLISKLHAYRMSNDSCKLLASYFTGRKQRVKLGSVKSDWLNVNIGAPQGSLLGPFLYNIFTNDLIMTAEKICEIYNYADDNSICCFDENCNNVIRKLEQVSNIMINWFDQNFLQANPEKFQAIIFSKDKQEKVLKIANKNVQTSNVVKLLGVYIDNEFNFSYHISELCKKSGRKINALARLANILDVQSKRCIYESFIISQLSYCSVVWHFCNVGDIRKLEKLQYRALKHIYGDFKATYAVLLQKSNLQLLYVQRLRYVLIELFKIIHKTGPIYLQDLCTIKYSHYNLRNDILLNQSKCNTIRYGINSFRYQGAHAWNLLPNELRTAANLMEFKKIINEWNGPKCNCNVCTMCLLYNL